MPPRPPFTVVVLAAARDPMGPPSAVRIEGAAGAPTLVGVGHSSRSSVRSGGPLVRVDESDLAAPAAPRPVGSTAGFVTRGEHPAGWAVEL